jgi:small multidrug resistance pump
VLLFVLFFVFYAMSMVFSNLAVKKIDIRVVYTIWSGVGAAAIALLGYLWAKEGIPPIETVSFALIVLGVIRLS